jgi:alpha-glucosidase
MSLEARAWWADAVVYQIYPRSFQDSDGDGIGDLRGVTSRLEYLEWLGVDALWLSPIYPSPLADMGYDVADYTSVAPEYGTLADLDELIARAHDRGIRVLLDLIPSHTSIEHPWFREHPDWYVWSDEGPPNNWLAAFGGAAWSRDERTGRWYLHSFYPEQPDLNWRNPEVRATFAEVIRFWIGRGADGFRVDAIDRVMKDAALRDDPPADEPFGLPVPPGHEGLAFVHSGDDPEIALALSAIREAAGDAFLVGEVYLPTARLGRYLEHFDAAFAFELLHSPFTASHLRSVLTRAPEGGPFAWVLSNHDFPRLATRLGSPRTAVAAMLLLTLPGPSFLYQGDEIGMADGPGTDPPFDRAGRDAHRHPMQWESGANGGFTTGAPWLPLTDPEARSVAGQRGQSGSMLELHRELITIRPQLGPGFELVDAPGEMLIYRRGEHSVALNLGDRAAPLPTGDVLVETAPGASAGAALTPLAGAVIRTG